MKFGAADVVRHELVITYRCLNEKRLKIINFPIIKNSSVINSETEDDGQFVSFICPYCKDKHQVKLYYKDE